MRCFLIIAVVLLFSAGIHMSKVGLDWDFFVFSQQWPPAVCMLGKEKNHTCNIPAEIQYWIVHGLWPSQSAGGKIENCNSSWPFEESQIQLIETQLDTIMPNLFNDTIHTSFWAREWDKHGTCCTDLSTTANELDYFKRIMELHSKFNLLRWITTLLQCGNFGDKCHLEKIVRVDNNITLDFYCIFCDLFSTMALVQNVKILPNKLEEKNFGRQWHQSREDLFIYTKKISGCTEERSGKGACSLLHT